MSAMINKSGDICVLNIIIETMLDNYIEADPSGVSDDTYLKVSNMMKKIHDVKNSDDYKLAKRLAVRYIKENVDDFHEYILKRYEVYMKVYVNMAVAYNILVRKLGFDK